jgi:hypothetical protein
MAIKLKQFILFLLLSLSLGSNIKSCPKYSCVQNRDTCAFTTSFARELGYNLVGLTDRCKEDEHCDVTEPYKTLARLETDEKFFCKQGKPDGRKKSRYPGEDCISNEDCYRDGVGVGECKIGKCVGKTLGESCAHQSDCLAGLYCGDNKCIPQKLFGSDCHESAECENKFLCYKGKCQLNLYSLDFGEELENDKDFLLFLYACKLGFSINGKCSYSVQNSIGDGPLRCNYDEGCKYDYFGTTEKGHQACDCGYNSEAQGYCEFGINKRKY